MSDDIVERLKGPRTPYGLPIQSDEARLHTAAADEITRLRAELAAAKIEIEKQRARVIKWVNAAMRNEEYDDDGR